jgi:peptidoglycan/LPS O-acetylase OafA/YrhL
MFQNVWRELQSNIEQELTWLSYFLRNNPAYVVAVVLLVVVLWALLKAEVKQK